MLWFLNYQFSFCLIFRFTLWLFCHALKLLTLLLAAVPFI